MKLNIETPTNTASGVGYSFGNRFSTSAGCWVTHLWWYRASSSPFPNTVYLVDRTSSTMLYNHVRTGLTWTDEGGGWHSLDIAANGGTPPALTSGHNFVVAIYGEDSGYLQAYKAHTPSPDAPLVAGTGCYENSDTGNPANANTGNEKYGVDITATTVDPGLPPATDPESTDPATAADLGQWLQSGNPQLRSDSLPKLIKDQLGSADFAQLATITTAVGAIGARAGGANKTGTTLFALVMWLIEHADDVTAALSNIFDLLGLTKESADDGTAYGLDILGIVSRERALLTTLPPDAGWELVDTLVWEGNFAWALAADAYVLNVATVPSTRPGVTTAAGLWLPKSGWWAPLNGSQAGDRSYVEWGEQLIDPRPRRLNGLAVQMRHPEYAGSCEAWRLALRTE